MKTNKPAFHVRYFWLMAVLIVLMGFALRSIDLLKLPMFDDEATHLARARDIAAGADFFAGADQNKWLYGVTVALFRPFGPEGLWIARWAAALASLLSIAACMGAARLLVDARAGLAAGLLYAVVPYATYFERRAYTDPQLAAFTALGLLFTVALIRRPRLHTALLLGLSLALARLTKGAAVPYFGLPFFALALMLLPPAGSGWLSRGQGHLRRAALYIALAVGLGLLIFAGVYSLGGQFAEVAADKRITPANSILGDGSLALLTARLPSDLYFLGRILVIFFGWGLIACLILGAAWLVMGTPAQRKTTLLLMAAGFGFMLVPMLASLTPGRFISRYMHINAAPLIVLAAVGLLWALDRLPPSRRLSYSLAAGIILLLPMMQFNLTMLRDPYALELGSEQALKDDFRRQAAETVVAAWRAEGEPPSFAVLTNGARSQYEARFGVMAPAIQIDAADAASLPYWAAQKTDVYVIEERYFDPLPDYFDDAELTLVIESDTGEGISRLYRLEGLRGTAAEAFYAQRVPPAQSMAADYAALLAGHAGTPLITFPGEHADFVRTSHSIQAEPLALATWPATASDAQVGLAPYLIEGQPLDVLLIDEARSDQQRIVLQGLLDSPAYIGGERWQGLLHQVSLIGGPAEVDMLPVNGVFEEAIHLESAALLDAQPAPGEHLRLALRWSTEQPIADSFSMFVHVVDAEGELIAQFDGLPGLGLRPTDTWQPGEVIIERRAVHIPEAAAPCRCEVRAGLYLPGSGLRLRVTDGPGGGEYITVGQVNIR